jgi:hypothetical protein
VDLTERLSPIFRAWPFSLSNAEIFSRGTDMSIPFLRTSSDKRGFVPRTKYNFFFGESQWDLC